MSDVIAAFFTTENLIALATLTGLEIVLGIDNVIFLAILVAKLPPEQRPKARFIGLSLAMFARIGLLLSITWVMTLTNPLFTVFSQEISGKDLILILGGLFLIAKSTHEIHHKLESAGLEEHHGGGGGGKASWTSILIQIVLIDIVFSLDSVITAVGMVNPTAGAAAGTLELTADGQAKIAVMVVAVIISIIVMIVFAGKIGDFVEKHPTIKILALAFLILIGVMLLVEGFDGHVNKGYIYFAMAFSLAIEFLNMTLRRKSTKAKVGGITGTPNPEGHVLKDEAT
jgi:predicted tellurium resistance membrane protein TerC